MINRATLFEHVIRPGQGGLATDLAHYILSLDFPPTDHERYNELALKAQSGVLSSEDQAELDAFLDFNDFLTLVQAKARTSLPEQNTAV